MQSIFNELISIVNEHNLLNIIAWLWVYKYLYMTKSSLIYGAKKSNQQWNLPVKEEFPWMESLYVCRIDIKKDCFYALSILLTAVESLIKNFSIIETKDTNQSPFKRIRAKGTVRKASTLLKRKRHGQNWNHVGSW